jgi:splicing factor U2AF 35 kDa subunit
MYGDPGVCKFFSKMGACRNGDGCILVHQKPSQSPTVVFPLMYPNPLAIDNLPDRPFNFTYDKKYLKKHFEHFYKNVWRTFMELGRIAELRVVSNLGDHLLGNVYIRFESKSDAARVVDQLRKKTFEGILLLPELSPVTDFANGCCKEDAQGECSRGGACNYLHIVRISKSVLEKLEKEQSKLYKKRDEKDKSRRSKRSRSRSPKERHERRRSRSRSPVKAHGDVCHICGKSGHISRDCPLKP